MLSPLALAFLEGFKLLVAAEPALADAVHELLHPGATTQDPPLAPKVLKDTASLASELEKPVGS